MTDLNEQLKRLSKLRSTDRYDEAYILSREILSSLDKKDESEQAAIARSRCDRVFEEELGRLAKLRSLERYNEAYALSRKLLTALDDNDKSNRVIMVRIRCQQALFLDAINRCREANALYDMVVDRLQRDADFRDNSLSCVLGLLREAVEERERAFGTDAPHSARARKVFERAHDSFWISHKDRLNTFLDALESTIAALVASQEPESPFAHQLNCDGDLPIGVYPLSDTSKIDWALVAPTLEPLVVARSALPAIGRLPVHIRRKNELLEWEIPALILETGPTGLEDVDNVLAGYITGFANQDHNLGELIDKMRHILRQHKKR